MRRISSVLALAVSAMLAACSGSPPTNAGPLANTSALPPPRGDARRSTLPSDLLFIPTENGAIDIYALKNPNKSGVIAQITGLQAFQDGMIVDAGGNLFVVNNGASGNDDYVLKYAP